MRIFKKVFIKQDSSSDFDKEKELNQLEDNLIEVLDIFDDLIQVEHDDCFENRTFVMPKFDRFDDALAIAKQLVSSDEKITIVNEDSFRYHNSIYSRIGRVSV